MARRNDTAAKNAKMAAQMKALGIERATHRCSVCYAIVSNGTKHFISCKGSK